MRPKAPVFIILLAVSMIFLFYVVYLRGGAHFALLKQAVLALFERRQELRDLIVSFGAFAPLAFVLIQAAQVVLSPIPGEATGFIGGFLFGLPAFFYSTVGLSLGSMGAFFIARYFRRFVRQWVEKSPYYVRFERLLEHQGIFVTFLLFVFPGFPKDFLCYFLGFSRIPWEVFCLVSTLGRMPGTLMLTFQGADLFEARFTRLFLVAGLTIVILVPMYLKRDALYAWIEKRTGL